MIAGIDFIGIGAQKSGTSWAYTCLYEHPEICAPVKEIHFFSRPRYSEGKDWYEAHFKKCDDSMLAGEFSTSYLYSLEAPSRIHSLYPNVKLIAILRNPVSRAYSQYRNAIKAGEIQESMSFEEYSKTEESVFAQGLYAAQLERYLTLFPRENVLILIYEDVKKDPVKFMESIYTFLQIDASFVASMVYDEINVARTPKLVPVDRTMHHIAEFLRKVGFDKFVHLIRRTGLPDMVRRFNTKEGVKKGNEAPYNHDELAKYFSEDVKNLSRIVGRDMSLEWNIK